MTSEHMLLTGQGTPSERLAALHDVFTPTHERMLLNLDYDAFLRTPYWSIIRAHIASERQACETCGSCTHLQVHHLTYKHHGREHEHLDDLQLLCRHCHSTAHGIPTVRDELRASDWRSAGELLPEAFARINREMEIA